MERDAQDVQEHAGYKAIQAICAVGPVMAAIFCAEISDVTRFPTARHLEIFGDPEPPRIPGRFTSSAADRVA